MRDPYTLRPKLFCLTALRAAVLGAYLILIRARHVHVEGVSVVRLLVEASGGLTMAFAIWKVVAAIFGLSYRYRWVLTTEMIILSAIVGSSLYLHFAWQRLYRPGTQQIFFAGVAAYAVVLVACSFIALAVDKADRAKRRVQEAHRVGDGKNDGDVS
jgi:hypothetical protein